MSRKTTKTTSAKIRSLLKKGIDGKSISISGENPGGSDSICYDVVLTTKTSSEVINGSDFDKFAQVNGFETGIDLIRKAEKYKLVRGCYVL